MVKRQFKAEINAPASIIWKHLWSETSYPQWTEPFTAGSRAESDWNKGSKVLFLDSENRGMVSIIEEKIPDQFMSFKHIGMIDNGVETTESEEHKDWWGAKENYTLNENNGTTEVIIDIDLSEKYATYFDEAWPKALTVLKELAEGEDA